MPSHTTRHSALFALFALLVTLLVIITAAIDTSAQSTIPSCPQIADVTLVNEAYTVNKTKCWYSGPWDVFMGWPGYSPYFFCSRNKPAGTIVYNAVETPTGDVKCVWMLGSEEPEYRHSTFRGFN